MIRKLLEQSKSNILEITGFFFLILSLYGLNALPVKSWFADGNLWYYGNIFQFSQLLSEPWGSFSGSLKPGDLGGLIAFGSDSLQPWNLFLISIARCIKWLGEPSYLVCVLPGLISYFLGGYILFKICLHDLNYLSKWCGYVIYLLLPMGVNISRSIIPESFAMFLLILQIAGLQQMVKRNSVATIVLLILVNSISIYCFPKNALISLGIFFWHFLRSYDKKSFFRDILPLVSIIVISLIAKKIYLVNSWTAGHSEQIFLLNIILSKEYWLGWWHIARDNFHFLLAFIPLTFLLRKKSQESSDIVLGILLGYFILGLFFTYHIFTHSYYSYPLLIVCPVSFAVVLNFILNLSFLNARKYFKSTIVIALPLGILFTFFPNYKDIILKSKKNVEISLDLKTRYEKLEFLTQKSDKIIFFAEGDGAYFQIFYARNGFPWPAKGNLWGERKTGKWKNVSEAEYFAHHLNMHKSKGASFFFTDRVKEFEEQDGNKDLVQKYLTQIYSDNSIKVFRVK